MLEFSAMIESYAMYRVGCGIVAHVRLFWAGSQ